VCAVYHSVTFLSLAGRIIRIPKGEGYVKPRVIVGGMFALFAGATIVIAGLLVLGGMGAR
jgi:fumarate reductase subunit C